MNVFIEANTRNNTINPLINLWCNKSAECQGKWWINQKQQNIILLQHDTIIVVDNIRMIN